MAGEGETFVSHRPAAQRSAAASPTRNTKQARKAHNGRRRETHTLTCPDPRPTRHTCGDTGSGQEKGPAHWGAHRERQKGHILTRKHTNTKPPPHPHTQPHKDMHTHVDLGADTCPCVWPREGSGLTLGGRAIRGAGQRERRGLSTPAAQMSRCSLCRQQPCWRNSPANTHTHMGSHTHT